MARSSQEFICQECGTVQPRWTGQCSGCGAWNSLVEEKIARPAPGGLGTQKIGKRSITPLKIERLDGEAPDIIRLITGIAEFDWVCGGGLVPGAAVLIGGDPGIGKSTLLLQIAARLSLLDRDCRCLYISGEEAIEQLRNRAYRLGVVEAPLELACSVNVRDIVADLKSPNPPKLVVIDSIQTMFVDALESAPGTVSQVRSSAQELIQMARKCRAVLLLVGHVTKEGMLAGPRVLEHMVDTVLYFEGERGHQFRILRAVKNRFGPTDEIGVFKMVASGLAEVSNPSSLFLDEQRSMVSGSAIFAGMEGVRPILVEIQALLSPMAYGTPRRSVVGWDTNRLAMIMAVLEARCGLALSGHDVYLNVVGGLRISEPAADLAAAAALISSHTGQPIPKGLVVFGEIGLSGEIRRVTQPEARLKEAMKLGFNRAWMPFQYKNQQPQETQIIHPSTTNSGALEPKDQQTEPMIEEFLLLSDFLACFDPK